jgi:RNA polymerase sigma factor (sigma-70 family)
MSGQPIAGRVPIAVEDSPADRVAALFDAHHERLYRLARRLSPSADDALDLVQETFLRATRAPKSVPLGAAREEAWLVRVLINLRHDQWRKAAVQKRHDAPGPSAEPDHGPAVIARTTVWRALDRLSPRRRSVVVMHELVAIAPLLRSAISNSATITGDYTQAEAKRIAEGIGTRLNSRCRLLG